MKKPWLSKTIWFNFIMATIAIFTPVVSDWAVQNSAVFTQIVAAFWMGVNFLLRYITKDKISLND